MPERFVCTLVQKALYKYSSFPLPFLLKTAASQGGSGPHLMMLPYAHRSRAPKPNGISIGSVVYARFAIVTDRQTDSQSTLLRL